MFAVAEQVLLGLLQPGCFVLSWLVPEPNDIIWYAPGTLAAEKGGEPEACI
jgi:hypothetical protein